MSHVVGLLLIHALPQVKRLSAAPCIAQILAAVNADFCITAADCVSTCCLHPTGFSGRKRKMRALKKLQSEKLNLDKAAMACQVTYARENQAAMLQEVTRKLRSAFRPAYKLSRELEKIEKEKPGTVREVANPAK